MSNYRVQLFFVLSLLFAVTNPGDSISHDSSSNFPSVIKHAKPAVVTVLVKKVSPSTNASDTSHQAFFEKDLIKDFLGSAPEKQKGKSSKDKISWGNGSGFIISEDGYLVTNHHVVKNGSEFTVFLQDRRTFQAKLIGSDAQSDIALLRIDDTNLPTLKFGDSSKLEVGEWAIAIGSPVEFIQTVTVGIISAKGRSSIGISEYEDFIQTDAAINPGNSGGPLLNIEGKVIGVNTAFMTQTGGFLGVGFAVPASMTKYIVSQLKNHGEVKRGWLGVSLRDCEAEEVLALKHPDYRTAAKVLKIRDNSPAKKAGLKEDDWLVAVNKEKISGAADLRNKISMILPGTTSSITLFRDSLLKTVRVQIAEKKDK